MRTFETSKLLRAFEAFLEIVIKIGAIIVGYFAFTQIGEYFDIKDINNFLFSLLILPVLYTLRDLPDVVLPFTIIVEADETKVTVHSGLHPRIKDTLEYKHIENYEISTTVLGRFRKGYSTVRLFSAGGMVTVPFIRKHDDFIEYIKQNRAPLKK